jgi:hypothetical protein
LSTIEYRIDGGRTLVLIEDGKVHPAASNSTLNTPLPVDACATLETNIPKRDLRALENAYRNNSPSDRCRDSTAPRQKVPAVVVRHPLPKDDDSYEWGKLRLTDSPPYRYCRGVTEVRLVLPPTVAPSQHLGRLGAQCSGPCKVGRDVNAGSVHAFCDEGGEVHAYQLGDNLYVVEEDHVRQDPLPCGVELDFRVAEFAVQLGLPRPTE